MKKDMMEPCPVTGGVTVTLCTFSIFLVFFQYDCHHIGFFSRPATLSGGFLPFLVIW
jgi:hypothetical protein